MPYSAIIAIENAEPVLCKISVDRERKSSGPEQWPSASSSGQVGPAASELWAFGDKNQIKSTTFRVPAVGTHLVRSWLSCKFNSHRWCAREFLADSQFHLMRLSRSAVLCSFAPAALLTPVARTAFSPMGVERERWKNEDYPRHRGKLASQIYSGFAAVQERQWLLCANIYWGQRCKCVWARAKQDYANFSQVALISLTVSKQGWALSWKMTRDCKIWFAINSKIWSRQTGKIRGQLKRILAYTNIDFLKTQYDQ